jgi:hypothetical protein
MVVHEHAKSRNVSESLTLLLVSVGDTLHALPVLPDVTDGEVHGVVEEAGEVVLVVAYVSWVSVEVLAHLEHSSGFSVLPPEVLWNFGDSIDSNSVEVELLNQVVDPVLKILPNEGVILIQIRKTSKSAVLYRLLVAPLDVAVIMVVIVLVEGVDLAEVVADGSDVVGHNIDHDPDALGMSS